MALLQQTQPAAPKIRQSSMRTFAACFVPALLCASASAQTPAPTATPVQHIVVIFQENVSFDHYFATFPGAANLSGENPFTSRQSALLQNPSVNGLTGALLTNNPNSTQPFRLSPSQNYTCDQDHDYTPEQLAFDHGLMDKFPENTGVGGTGCPDYGKGTGLTMGYYDGNTVTALWNYAQYFAMNDNMFGTTFGPSTPGALNLVSGNTGTFDASHTAGDISGDVIGSSVIGDPDPFYDDCSGSSRVGMTGQNVGDLLNAAGVSWGWFEGGFIPTSVSNGVAVCGAATPNLGGVVQTDYSPHHEPFQYYASTSNPHHVAPSSNAMIGLSDQANHQYDLVNFWSAVKVHHMPAVSFLKAKRSQDGHAGYSSPLDEQIFIVNTINQLQLTPEWASTMVVVTYDDSDGWYDHQAPTIMNQSATSADAYTDLGYCGSGVNALGGIQGRCGYGPRLPLLVVSPFSKVGFVDHTLTDQSSILRFIEDNWLDSKRISGSYDAIAGPLTSMVNWSGFRAPKLVLDPNTGQIIAPVNDQSGTAQMSSR